jgi:uncharacterized protein
VTATTPPFDADALARASDRLERFGEALPSHEQAALRVLLSRASLLTPREAGVYDRLRGETDPEPGGVPALTVIMKATRLCNLRCTYCHSWRAGPNQTMTFPVLANAIRDALRDPSVRWVDFVWHGGEATLLPPAFYRKALWLQARFARPGQVVLNSVQTNGTRLTDEWLAFLREHDFGVGVSLDGPPEVHDTRRVDAAGRPTAAYVREGLEQLERAGIERRGVLMVVDEAVCAVGARRILEYLVDIGVRQVALLNVLPENTSSGAGVQGSYLPFPTFVDFLRDVFDVWWTEYRNRIVVRELSDLVGQLSGKPPQICVFAGECFGAYLTVEPTGEVSACDKYIDDDGYRFGHVLTTGLTGAQLSRRLRSVKEQNRRALDRMRACPGFAVCHGGCPHDRYTGERLLAGYDGRCCGLAPLLEHMNLALEQTTAKARSDVDSAVPAAVA